MGTEWFVESLEGIGRMLREANLARTDILILLWSSNMVLP